MPLHINQAEIACSKQHTAVPLELFEEKKTSWCPTAPHKQNVNAVSPKSVTSLCFYALYQSSPCHDSKETEQKLCSSDSWACKYKRVHESKKTKGKKKINLLNESTNSIVKAARERWLSFHWLPTTTILRLMNNILNGNVYTSLSGNFEHCPDAASPSHALWVTSRAHSLVPPGRFLQGHMKFSHLGDFCRGYFLSVTKSGTLHFKGVREAIQLTVISALFGPIRRKHASCSVKLYLSLSYRPLCASLLAVGPCDINFVIRVCTRRLCADQRVQKQRDKKLNQLPSTNT